MSFETLPKEALISLFLVANPLELGVYAQVCKKWASLIGEQELWRRICQKRWTSLPSEKDLKQNWMIPRNKEGRIDWRRYFIIRDLFDLVRKQIGLETSDNAQSLPASHFRGRGRRGRGNRGKNAKQKQVNAPKPQTVLNPQEVRRIIDSLENWIDKIVLERVETAQFAIFSLLVFLLDCVELWLFNSHPTQSEEQIVEDVIDVMETLLDTVTLTSNVDPLGSYTPKLIHKLVQTTNNTLQHSNLQVKTTGLYLFKRLCGLLFDGERPPVHVRKYPNAIRELFFCVMDTLHLFPSNEWNEDDTKFVAVDSNGPNEELEEPLDHIAFCVGGKVLLPMFIEKSKELMNSTDFKQHYAILFTLGTIAEGCADELKRQPDTLNTLMQTFILPHLSYPHADVIANSIRCLALLLEEVSPEMQNKFGVEILSHLLPFVENFEKKRYQILATATLVNFFSQLSGSFDATPLLPFLDRLMNVLYKLSEDHLPEFRRQALSAMICIVKTFRSHIANYSTLSATKFLEKIKSTTISDFERMKYFKLLCTFAAAVKTTPFISSVKDAVAFMLERHKQLLEEETKSNRSQTASTISESTINGLNSTTFNFAPQSIPKQSVAQSGFPFKPLPNAFTFETSSNSQLSAGAFTFGPNSSQGTSQTQPSLTFSFGPTSSSSSSGFTFNFSSISSAPKGEKGASQQTLSPSQSREKPQNQNLFNFTPVFGTTSLTGTGDESKKEGKKKKTQKEDTKKKESELTKFDFTSQLKKLKEELENIQDDDDDEDENEDKSVEEGPLTAEEFMKKFCLQSEVIAEALGSDFTEYINEFFPTVLKTMADELEPIPREVRFDLYDDEVDEDEEEDEEEDEDEDEDDIEYENRGGRGRGRGQRGKERGRGRGQRGRGRRGRGRGQDGNLQRNEGDENDSEGDSDNEHDADLINELLDLENENDLDNGNEPFQIEQQNMYVNRNIVEERCDAVITVTAYAKHMKEAFYPFLRPTLDAFFKLLNYTWNRELPSLVVRGLVSMWKVVVAYSEKHPEIEQQNEGLNKSTVFNLLLQHFFSEFQQFGDDSREEERWIGFEKILKWTPKDYMNDTHMRTIFEAVLNYFAFVEEFEDEEATDLTTRNDVIDEMSVVLEMLMKTQSKVFKEVFDPESDELASVILNEFVADPKFLINPKYPRFQRQYGLRFGFLVLTSLVENFKESHFKEYIPRVLAELSSSNPLVTQTTTYAIGAYAEHLKDDFAPFTGQALRLLKEFYQKYAENEEFEDSVANCISSIGKLLVHQQKSMENEYNTTLEFWLKLLPNKRDATEGKETTSLLLVLVERHKSDFANKDSKFAAEMRRILTQTLENSDLFHPKDLPSLQQLAQQLG
jgi:hypothetical protein